jgi:hypothetical protein
MEKQIISISHVDISPESLLSSLHMKKEDDLTEDVIMMLQEARNIAKPVALYSLLSPDLHDGEVWLGGVKFKEPFVYKMLSDRDYFIPYVATCGQEIDAWSKSFTDVFEQFIADTFKEMCLRLVIKELRDEVKEKHFSGDGNISTLNPGSLKEWPISGQKSLFHLLGGVTNDIGVVLSDSLLMSPTKSVSGIMFQSEETYHNCQLCPRTDCSNRRAPYADDQDQVVTNQTL